MYYIIINPKSRSGLGLSIWEEIRCVFVRKNLPFTPFLTTHREHAEKLAAKLTADNRWNPEDTLIVIGGDGTMNEVMNGICDLSRVCVGYIPTGSGNDFARNTGLPTEPLQALTCILQKKQITGIDIGVLQSGNKKKKFLISSGIGFDAAICHEALSSKIKNTLNRFHLGKLTYTLIALKQWMSFRTFSLDLTVDGKEFHFDHAYLCVSMNQQYEGGGLRFCPDADYTDRKLDLMIVHNIPKWKLLLLLPTAFSGKHTRFPYVTIMSFENAHIMTDIKTAVHLDGESGGYQDQIRISLNPSAMQLITAN